MFRSPGADERVSVASVAGNKKAPAEAGAGKVVGETEF